MLLVYQVVSENVADLPSSESEKSLIPSAETTGINASSCTPNREQE
jgi:hypothetical protein